MALILKIMLGAILTIALTLAVPIPGQEQGKLELHKLDTPPPHRYPIVLPSHHSIIRPIDYNRHRVVPRPHKIEHRKVTDIVASAHKNGVKFLLMHPHLRAHITDGHHSSQHVEGPRNSTMLQRQNSVAGRLLTGAVQGLADAGTEAASDHVSDALTGNDRDHLHKSKEQLKEEKEEVKEDEEKKERKPKEKEEEEKEDKEQEEKKKQDEKELDRD